MHSAIIIIVYPNVYRYAPKCLQAYKTRWQKVPRLQLQLNKNHLLTILELDKFHNCKVTRKVHIPKLGISPTWRSIQRGFKAAVTKLSSHFRWYTLFSQLLSWFRSTWVSLNHAEEMYLFFYVSFYVPSNSDFKLAINSHNLLFLDIYLWKSDTLYIYSPPL